MCNVRARRGTGTAAFRRRRRPARPAVRDGPCGRGCCSASAAPDRAWRPARRRRALSRRSRHQRTRGRAQDRPTAPVVARRMPRSAVGAAPDGAPAGRGAHGAARVAVRPIASRPGNPSRRAARARRDRTSAHSATPRGRRHDMKVMPMESRFLASHAGPHDRGTRHGARRRRSLRSFRRWRAIVHGALDRRGGAARNRALDARRGGPSRCAATAAADRGRRSRDAPSPPDAGQRVVPCADRRAHDARPRAAPRRPAAPDASSTAGTRRTRFMPRRSPAKPSAVPAGPHIRSPHALVVGAPAGARTGRQGATRAARISTKVSTPPVPATSRVRRVFWLKRPPFVRGGTKPDRCSKADYWTRLNFCTRFPESTSPV